LVQLQLQALSFAESGNQNKDSRKPTILVLIALYFTYIIETEYNLVLVLIAVVLQSVHGPIVPVIVL
jgi:hypothetical protein